MKKLLLTAAAALTFFSPLATVSAFAQDRGGRQSQDQQRQDGERYQDGQGRADQRYQDDQNRADQGQQTRGDRRDHRGHRGAWRDNRRDARWDEAQHNGYYQNSQWHYGPPHADLYGRRGVQLGYRPWSRGQRLGYYNTRYQEVDYRSARDYRGHALRQPPRGYRWVRDNDGGDYLLAALAGGLIAQVILSSDRRY